MKSIFISLLSRQLATLFTTITIWSVSGIFGQNNQLVTGKLIDEKSNQAVPYASVTLIKVPESRLMTGNISDENGIFKISPVPAGKYLLSVFLTGYKRFSVSIDVIHEGVTDAGIIFMEDSTTFLEEAVVVGDRIKARSEKDRTTFYITRKMLNMSTTGTDVLKLLPGISVDLMHNISLEGSRDILIFVNGKEHDRSFLSQLNAEQIEKIEIMSAPPSNYDGHITGVINIILKKERDYGFSGQINAEIPVSRQVFVAPSYSLNYGFKKWNFYTSYNGGIIYFDNKESIYRRINNGADSSVFRSDQHVRQKDWSHRFHYGFDYFLSKNDQLNFYATFNPYSRELDGTSIMEISGNKNNRWNGKKGDTDINTATSYSLYYKHNFAKEGCKITADISTYNLRAENSTEYIYDATENNTVYKINTVKPEQNSKNIKVDFTTPLLHKLNFNTGVKARFSLMQDRNSEDFEYKEKIMAVFGTLAYENTKYDLSMGLRAEQSVSDLQNHFSRSVLSFLPYAVFRYKLTSVQNIRLSYNRSVSRPALYQLNPFVSYNDPYLVSRGNPFLNAEIRSSISFEHSIQFKGNYVSSRLFYNLNSDAINQLAFINDTGTFEIQVQNLGTIQTYGAQFSGTLKLGVVTLNPYIQLFNRYTSANTLAKKYAVINRQNPGFETGVSTVFSLKKDMAFSFIFQYASPKNNIQNNAYSDALYFLSLEKTFRNKIKAGIVTALPLNKSFVYQGTEIEASGFYLRQTGTIKLSAIPVWLKVSYQFNSGKNREKINYTRDENETRPKKGF